MGTLIFGLLLILALIGMLIYFAVQDKIKKDQRKHYKSLFKPGYKIELRQVEGHVRPFEHLYFEYDIIDAKDGYIIVKQTDGSGFEEEERNIFSILTFYDIVDVYDGEGTLIERIHKEDVEKTLH